MPVVTTSPETPATPRLVRSLGAAAVAFAGIGVGIAVMAVMVILYYNLVSRGRQDEGL